MEFLLLALGTSLLKIRIAQPKRKKQRCTICLGQPLRCDFSCQPRNN